MNSAPLPSTPVARAGLLAVLARGEVWLVVVWSLALAAGGALLDAAPRYAAAQVAQPILLLPDRAPEEPQRRELATLINREAFVSAVAWRSPDELLRDLKSTLPDADWGGLFPEDQAWTPWVLQVWPRNPLGNPGAINDFVAARRREATWRLVLWDGAPVAALAKRLAIARGVMLLWMLLMGAGGALAVAQWPADSSLGDAADLGGNPAGPRRSRTSAWIAQTGLGLAATGAVWAAVPLLGGPSDLRALAVALAVAFVLAGVAAPMLRVRRAPSPALPQNTPSSSILARPQASKMSITLGEASDERSSTR